MELSPWSVVMGVALLLALWMAFRATRMLFKTDAFDGMGRVLLLMLVWFVPFVGPLVIRRMVISELSGSKTGQARAELMGACSFGFGFGGSSPSSQWNDSYGSLGDGHDSSGSSGGGDGGGGGE